MQALTNHWRPTPRDTAKGLGFVRYNRNEKGAIQVLGSVACEPTGASCKCGGTILQYATYGSTACGKCCAGLPQ